MANPLESFKKLSTGGKVAVGAGGLGALYLAWRYKQNHSAAASSSSSDPNAIDPLTGMPYSQDNTIDPLTGESYLAEAQQYGSVTAAEQAYSGSGAVDYSQAYGYAGGGGTALQPVTTVNSSTYATNAAWAQAAQAGLSDVGYSATDISAALGAYLAGLPLTGAQATIVEAAIAEYGPPPQGAPPISMQSSSSPSQPSSGSTGTASPGPGGVATAPKGGPITVIPADLHTTQVSATSVGVAWAAPTIPAGQGPLTGYTLQVYNANGTPEGTPWTVPAGQLYGNAGGLKSKTPYHLNVWCDPAKTGGPHATVSFTTK